MNLLLRCIFLYYALPSLVFFYGWYEPWVCLPVIALVVWGILRAEPELSEKVSMKGGALWCFVIGALLICVQQWLAGYTGHFPQHGDFSARNAVFGSLCRESWPMASKEGYPFVYYAAAWLPSALLKKCIPVLDADWLFMIQNCLALIAAFYLLCCRIGRVSLWLVAGALCLDAYVWALQGVYDALFGGSWSTVLHCERIFPSWPNLIIQTQTTVNHGPYLILAMCLMLLPFRRPATYILIGALLLPISPLGAAGLFPFLIWRLFRGGLSVRSLLRSAETWSGVLIFAACVLYYAQSAVQSCSMSFIWQLPSFSEVYQRVFFNWVLNVGLFGLVFIPFCFKRTEFWIAYGLFVLLPFIFYGCNYNELLYKASAVCFVVFAALLPELFAGKGHWISKSLVMLMLLKAVFVSVRGVCNDWSHFGDREHNVADIYKRDYYGEKAIADRNGGSSYLLMRDAPARILIPYVLKTPSPR